jgi:acyl-CoA hydrolase
MVFITEQGVADIRGLTPLKRAKLIINNCAHPDYREQLLEYLNYSSHNFPGHEPQALEHAFDMQKAFIQSGTMLK